MKVLSKKDIKLPRHKSSSHKGQNGKLLIIGGSDDYVGALVLAGLAALRAGCDWVTIAAPKKVAWVINTLSPDLVTKKLKGQFLNKSHLNALLKLSAGFDAVLIGNGAGTKKETQSLIKSFVRKSKVPVVVDADGLKAIGFKDLVYGVMTPHVGELAALFKNSNVKGNPAAGDTLFQSRIQKQLGQNVLVLKGKTDLIFTKQKLLKNRTGNAGMTKAGTGDVLAGLIAGFIAQGMPLLEAAKAGAYINGVVGDALFKKRKYYNYLASDLVVDIRTITNRYRPK